MFSMYKTQMEAAKHGEITKEIALVAQKEKLEPEILRQRVATPPSARKAWARACAPKST